MTHERTAEVRPQGAVSSDVGELAMRLAKAISREDRYCPECPDGVPAEVKADTHRVAAMLVSLVRPASAVHIGDTFEHAGEAYEVTEAPLYQLTGNGGTRVATLEDLLDAKGAWRRRVVGMAGEGWQIHGPARFDALVVELLTLKAMEFLTLRTMVENRRGSSASSGTLTDALDRIGAVKVGARWTIPGTEAAERWAREDHGRALAFDTSSEPVNPAELRVGLSLEGQVAAAGPSKAVVFDAAKGMASIEDDPRDGALSADDTAKVQSLLGGKPAECAARIAVDVAAWHGRLATTGELAAAAAHLRQTARTIDALAGRSEP